MCPIDESPWDRTKDFVSTYELDGRRYFPIMYRAVVTVAGRSYPCWIGPKNGRTGAGAILILKEGVQFPAGNTDTQPVSLGKINGYECWRFKNAGAAENEGYGEMRRYLWNRRDEDAVIVIHRSAKLTDISAGNIVGQLNDDLAEP